MPRQIRLRRGLAANVTAASSTEGEPLYSTDTKRLYIADNGGNKTPINDADLRFGTCSTAADAVAKTVSCDSFVLRTGAPIFVKFTITNTAASPTLNVNNTGAKPIFHRNAAIAAGTLGANRLYLFVYNGTQFELVGDVDTNTTYSVMGQAEADAGTVTTGRLITAKVLADWLTAKTGATAGKIPVVDAGGKLDPTIIPQQAITDVFSAASDAAMTALAAHSGDVCIRTDVSKTFILKTNPATTLANWVQLPIPQDLVLSVAGKTGAVTLAKGDVGLGSVENFGTATQSEAEAGTVTNKFMTPQRTAQAVTALSPVKSVAGKTGAVTLAKGDVGLGSVDNTADSAKSVSKAATLTTARTIDGVSFNGGANITHFGTCDTAAATVEKVVALSGFTLATGASLKVLFTITNTAANPTLNVNSTGAKPIFYRNAAISAGVLGANRIYEFVYDGTQFELVGDVDSNTSYSVMEVAEGTAGSATTTRVMRADYLKSIILGTVLTGLSTATNAAITATDSLLAALGKLQAQISAKANLASPALTGTPTAPTASSGANSTQIATTAFVQTELNTIDGGTF